MEPITYRLNIDGPAAASYYPAVRAFTDDVLAEAERSVMPLASAFRRFIIDYELEGPRSAEEYAYELLNFGILWRAYGPTAMQVRVAPFRTLSTLAEWRKRHQRLKPAIDVLRGVVMSLFLVPTAAFPTSVPPRTLRDIERLVEWLAATGDFREDALRYIRWLGYWGTVSTRTLEGHLQTINAFAAWFESESRARMGSFTPSVESFVRVHISRYRWREDRFSCLRSRTEYHLNMVGAEIMNRAYRPAFLSAEQKTVLLPGCMRHRTPDTCKGTKSLDGVVCTGCEPSCKVNQLREIGLRQGFDVAVLPHSTDLSRWASKPGAPSTAVVGVACLSVLVQGGWELKRHGVPAQCVLLNECGCKKHWHKDGFPTELDVRELRRVVRPDPVPVPNAADQR